MSAASNVLTLIIDSLFLSYKLPALTFKNSWKCKNIMLSKFSYNTYITTRPMSYSTKYVIS